VAGSKATSPAGRFALASPVEDRRGVDSSREAMLEGFALGSYLLLVDYTCRLFREGKAKISREAGNLRHPFFSAGGE
jgi:hypothetical protein